MKPTLVIDSSITLSWFFPDEATPASGAVLDSLRLESVVVPVHWRLELANVIVLAERKGRTTRFQADEFLHSLADLPIFVQDQNESFFNDVIAISRRHRLTTYDAAYLHLARTHACPLATLDQQLRDVSTSLGVEVRGI